jgi:hypothetical protein
VLHEETSIGVLDTHYVVFTDHHDSEGVRVSLVSAGDGLDISINTIFKGAFLALVVDNGPGHGDLIKTGGLSVRVEYLSVSVSELPDHSSFLGADSSNLTGVCLLLTDKVLSGLADLTVTKILDKKTVREGNSSERSSLVDHVLSE